MSLVTLQKLPVLALRLSRPPLGAWIATLEVDYQDSEELFDGVVELRDEKVSYQGTVLRGGVLSGVARIELTGGHGGLVKDCRAQHFRDVTVRTAVESLLRGVGEALDNTSTRAVLERKLPFWSFEVGRASRVLTVLADRLGAAWRVLPNGNVWFGIDTFPDAGDELKASLLELDRDDAAASVLLATESLELGPGVTYGGRSVGRVEHSFSRTESPRATFWTADAA